MLLGLMLALTVAEHLTLGDERDILRTTLPMTTLFLAGAAYLVASFVSARWDLARPQVLLMIAVAVGMRGAAWCAPPGRGDDFERYLWDGAVTAAGANPYQYAPQRVWEGNGEEPVIRSLAREGRDVLRRINHAHLRTIYPPVAQGFFAGGYLLTPFDITGWRIVLLIMDGLAGLALMLLLRAARLPSTHLTIYLWNPLLVFETYARLHLDLAVAPVILLLVWALMTRRAAVAGLALAVAAGIKLWPLLLAPFVAGVFWEDRRRLASALGMFAVLTLLMAVPFASALGGEDSGIAAYSMAWENATGAYRILHGLGWLLVQALHLPWGSGLVGRALTMATLLAIAARAGWRTATDAQELCGSVGTVVVLMLLLSPTVWPWYYVPLIPLAAIAPRGRFFIWTLLLPLIYLAGAWPGEHAVAMMVHVPVWVLLAVDAMRPPRRASAARV